MTDRSDSAESFPAPSAPERALTVRDRQRMADAAELYWVRGLKLEEVGHELGMSRSTVSRQLARARQEGIIEFRVHREVSSAATLTSQLGERFSVIPRIALAENPHDANSRLAAVGHEAAAWIPGFVHPHTTMTVAWGSTIGRLSTYLRQTPVADTHVVQLHGSGNIPTLDTHYVSQILERFGTAFGAAVEYLPVPAFFDSPQTRRLMWQEKSVHRVLNLRAHSDLLITSVGTPSGDLPGHLYDSGYLRSEDLAELQREHVIGNLGAIFFRKDSSSDGIAVNNRSTGMPFEQLRRIPIRLLVAADPAKAQAIGGLLRAGLATHVVFDTATAAEVLALDQAGQ